MADICPVCNKEIKTEDREEYKFSSESSPISVHNFCLGELVSKPEGYFEKLREELAIEKERAIEREKKDIKDFKESATESRTIERKQEQIIEKYTVQVTNFDMPLGNMVLFMVKWAIASIPAFIILAIIVGIFFVIFEALFF